MSPIAGAARKAARKLTRAYYLICARDEVRARGLRTPIGVWFCDRCRIVALDRTTFIRHAHAHTA